MIVEIEFAEEFEGIHRLIAEAIGRVGLLVSEDPWLDVPEESPPVTMVLGGNQQALDWDVEGEVLGFHAVMSNARFEDDDVWYEVNERVEVHVNVANLAKLAQDADLEDMVSLLATVPHELLHACDWLRATGGRTPIQVYDEGHGGTIAIRNALNEATLLRLRLSGDVFAQEEDLEDLVEEASFAIIARRCHGEAAALLSALEKAEKVSSPAN